MSTDYSQAAKDILNGLTSPTADEAYHATRAYDERYIAAALASLQAAGGGGGSQAVSVIDATVTADDLNGGAVTIYQPASAGEVVMVTFDLRDAVALSPSLDAFVGQNPEYVDGDPQAWLWTIDLAVATIAQQWRFVLPTTDPLIVSLFIYDIDDATKVNLPAAVTDWQANHAYAQRAVVVGTDGLFHVCSVAGTSGGSEPTWPVENDSGTVVDGTATWYGAQTTASAFNLHFFGFAGTPS